MMKLKSVIIASMMLLPSGALIANNNLPTVDLQGKKYYYYEVQKDDSLYGIAMRMGWDVQIIVAANPGTETNLRRGQRVYYPVGEEKTTMPTSVNEEQAIDAVYHQVKPGESVYSIASLYGLTPDDIYAANKNARYGIKVGDRLVVQDATTIATDDSNATIYYTVDTDDTLNSLADEFSTSVEEILRLNPGISASSLNEGDNLRLSPNTDQQHLEVRNVERVEVNSFRPYCIERNDTWTSIAESNGITIEELRAANEGITQLKKGRYLSIPVFETISVEETIVEEDPRELTAEGRQQLYDQVHDIDQVETEQSVDIGMMLTVADNTEREAEFLRGALVAIDEMKHNPYKINLHVYDATAHSQAIDSILSLPEVADLDMIITTFDKNYPLTVADYGQQNNIEIVNVFDVKSNLCSTHSNFIQLLPPTSYFNDAIFDYIWQNFNERKFIFVGSSIASDSGALDNMIKTALNDYGMEYIQVDAVEQLETVNFSQDGTQYVVYPQLTKKADIDKFVATLSTIVEDMPQLDLMLLTRPNWVVYAQKYKDKFSLFNTFIPSRFYYAADSVEARLFADSFLDKFGEKPIISNPVYAAVGYDVMKFFVQSEYFNHGDYNNGFTDYNAIQTDFHLSRLSNWSGFINKCVYLVNFTPSGTVEKITLN